MSEQITITAMSYGPDGIGRRANGQVVFVPGTTPGDVVDIVLTSEKDSYCRGQLVRLIEPGPDRVDPSTDVAAPVAEALAPWSHLAYDAQLIAKRGAVVDALCKVATYDRDRAEALVNPVTASPEPKSYRNKIELECSTSGPLTLGVHAPKSHRSIPVERYPLANRLLSEAPKALLGAIRFLSGAKDLGIYRVSLRASERTRAFELAFWTKHGPFPRSSVPTIMGSALPLTSIVRIIGQPGSERKVTRLERLDGPGVWKERLAGTRFAVSAPAFFQVNTAVAESIVERVRDWAAPAGSVADLYAGVGTFTAPLLAAGHKVTAVELTAQAIQNLRTNAAAYEDQATIIGGDAARAADEWREAALLVLDPPRAGLAPQMPELVAQSAAREVVYLSCDPQTWARDCVRLSALGFTLDRVEPFDMFPQTYHVEVLSHFSRQR